jgi:hypothetical protein
MEDYLSSNHEDWQSMFEAVFSDYVDLKAEHEVGDRLSWEVEKQAKAVVDILICAHIAGYTLKLEDNQP